MQPNRDAQRATCGADAHVADKALVGVAPLGAAGAPPPVAATNDNAGLQPGVEVEVGMMTIAHCAATDSECKQFSTIRARAALCGCTLHEPSGGTYLLGCRGLSREVPCLRAVGDLLRQIGGAHA
jgi:hypothetical protein